MTTTDGEKGPYFGQIEEIIRLKERKGERGG